MGSRSGGRRETGGKSHSLLYHQLIARQKNRFEGVQGPPGVYEKPRKNIDCRIHQGFAEQQDPGVYGKSTRKHIEIYTPAKFDRPQFILTFFRVFLRRNLGTPHKNTLALVADTVLASVSVLVLVLVPVPVAVSVRLCANPLPQCFWANLTPCIFFAQW